VRFVWVGERPSVDDAGWYWGAGYAFTPEGALVEGHEVGRYLRDRAERVDAAAATLNGCFAAAFGHGDTAVLVTDRYGTVPLFLGRPSATGGAVLAGDDPWGIVGELPGPPSLDPVGVLDMLRLGYVAGERTLLEGVQSLALGTVARVHAGTVRRRRYWRIRYPEPPRRPSRAAGPNDDAAWFATLDDAYTQVGARVDAFCTARGRPARLMATGGLDTRALAGMLATRSNASVEIMSYGASRDADVDAAEQIARAMNWPFTAVPVRADDFGDAMLRCAAREIGLTARFTCGAGARAVPEPGNAVTMLGHTGFLSSDMQRRNLLVATPSQVRRMIEMVHYAYPGGDDMVRRAAPGIAADLWGRSLEETLADADPSQPITEMHRWAAENRHRKLVHLEGRVYARRGAWMFPLHDPALVDVYGAIPWRLRVAQRLYALHALDHLLVGKGAPLARIPRVGHGGEFAVDDRLYRIFEATRPFQPVAGEVAARVGPIAWRVANRVRPEWHLTSGPAPLRHWFHTDPRVRAVVLERLGDATNGLLDGPALRDIALDPATGENAFQRLLAGALTVSAVEETARDVWREHRGARSA
jgi:hypothetical protein